MRAMRRHLLSLCGSLIQNPDSIFIAVSKAAFEVLNNWAVQYRFSGRPMATMQNKLGHLELHMEMRVMLARSLNTQSL